ncbi:hypothetical protein EYR40_010508 [Pleurotus pulmonarius]|nr:hypothetical protein EYR40_010508 [Pleurotus pulmonarius]
MDHGAHKILESATFRTLHAQNFSRASTQASCVLTDLLERYLTLLSATAGRFAEHAGRGRNIGVRDAVGALDELGVGVEELRDWWVSEGGEMSGRYGIKGAWLGEFNAQLADGLKQDTDDVFPLHYRPLDEIAYEQPAEDESEADNGAGEEDYEMMMDTDVNVLEASAPFVRKAEHPPLSASTTRPPQLRSPKSPSSYSLPPIQTSFSSPGRHPPTLPLSPVSNPGSPSRKRARTASWKAPQHVPNFLPPFPTMSIHAGGAADGEGDTLADVQLASLSQEPTQSGLDIGMAKAEIQGQTSIPNPTAQAAAAAVTAAQVVTSSDYLSQVPYSESTLSSVPEWHLPQPPPPPPTNPVSTRLPTPQTEPAFIKAYHHILTHSSQSHASHAYGYPQTNGHTNVGNGVSNPLRHKVAMALMFEMQCAPRWDIADTLFGGVGPCAPRGAVVGPTHPLPIASEGGGSGKDKEKEIKLPGAQPRAVSTSERVAHLVSQQSSRIPELARRVLPPAILTRTSRLSHPGIITRGAQKFTYGAGLPAPWNGGANSVSSANGGKSKGSKGNKDKSGVDKEDFDDDEKGDAGGREVVQSAALPDARMFATWDAEKKDYRTPLHMQAGSPSSAMQRSTKRTRPPNLALLSKELGASSNISLDSDSDEDVDLDADGPELDDDDTISPPHSNGVHKHSRTLPILTLDSDGDEDKDDDGADDDIKLGLGDDADADELSKDLRALEKLRKSVQKNLRLRPIRSSQRLPKVSLTPSANSEASPASAKSLLSKSPSFQRLRKPSSQSSLTPTEPAPSPSPSPSTGVRSPSSSVSYSSSKSPSSPWNAVDSTSSTDDTETDVDTDVNTVDTDVSASTMDTNVSDEPMSATSIISNYFTPLSEHNPSPTSFLISHPPLSPPIQTSLVPTPITPDHLQSILTTRDTRPLMIDTRPPPVHLAAHVVDSVNLAIPSLLLKRTRKQKRSVTSTTFPTLHSLRQYITTDESLTVWDSLLVQGQPSPRWDGTLVVYDHHMDASQKEDPNSASWTLLYILEPILRDVPTGRLCYLEGGFAAALSRKDFASGYIVAGNSTTGSAFVGNGGWLTEPDVKKPKPNETSSLKKLPSLGLFQLDTQTAARSKQLPEIDLSSSATASPSESRHDFSTSSSSPNLSPNPQGSSSNVSSPSPTRLHHLHVSPPTSYLTAHTSSYLGDPPRSPMPVMPSAMAASSPISPYMNGRFKSSSLGVEPTKPKLGLDIRSTEGLPRLDIKSAAAVSSLPRLDIKSATRTKSAERLPKLSLRTTGIGPSVKGRSATLSVPPSAIGDGGGFANNIRGGGGTGVDNTAGGLAWGSSVGGSGYGGHGNQAMRSPVDWGFLNAGYGKMAQTVTGVQLNQDGANGNGEKLGEADRGRSRDKGGEDRLTPYYTPPHSPGTPKAPVFEGCPTGFDDMRSENGIPPSPKTARPDSSSPAPGFPPFLPRVDVVGSDSSSNGDISYPASPSHAEFPRSPMAMSFGMDPPPTAFGSSFPHHSDLDHDPRSDDTDGPPTTEDPHPPFTVSIILPQFLFLGPEPSAEDHLQMLKDHGVKRILNLAIECDENDHGLALAQTFEKYTKIAMRDHVEEEGVVGKVREVCDILDDARLHSAPTFVHCKAGKSRSVTAIIAYLIHANHWTLSKAYAFVLERRKGISPNIGFVSELMTFEEEELGGKSIGVQPSVPGGQQGDSSVNQAYHGVGAGGRRGGHIRESLPPVFTTAGPVSALEPIGNGLGGEGDAGPMSAGTLLVGSVRAEVGQDMEIKDAQGRWRHARRAPVDEQTLQPMRRVSKAGLESSAYGYGVP